MNAETLFGELEDLLRRLGVTITQEKLAATAPWVKGGLYRMKGKTYCVVDSGAPVRENNNVLREALQKLDLDGVYIKPAVREFIGGPEVQAEVEPEVEAEVKEEKKGPAANRRDKMR